MTPEELKARARRLAQEVFTQGDLAVADELVTPDYVHHMPGPQPVHGVTGLKEWVTLLRRTFPDVHLILEDEIAEADRVVNRITVRGTHEGEFLGIPPTGRQVAFDVIDINRTGAGRQVRRALVIDRLARPTPSAWRAAPRMPRRSRSAGKEDRP